MWTKKQFLSSKSLGQTNENFSFYESQIVFAHFKASLKIRWDLGSRGG